MSKLNVAIFCMGSLGGSSEVAVNLALALRANGHDCDVFAYENAMQERLLREGIRIRTPNSLSYAIFDHIQTDFGFLVAFDKLHKKKPYDIIHVHYAVPLIHVMSNLRDIYGIPCVVTFHGSDVTIVPDLFDVSMLTKLVEKAEASVTVASRFLADSVEKVYKLERSRIHLIPNTIAPEFFGEFARKREEPPYFVHVSGLRPVKRVWDIVLAMCCLRKKLAHGATNAAPRLKIIGDGPDLPDLHLLSEKCGLHDDVDFLGQIDERREVASIVSSADALILSSLTESQPLVILESMAVGTPVICSSFTSAPELIGENGERGWIFEIGDSQALARIMQDVIESPEMAVQRAVRAREWVLREHHMDAVTKAYVDLYGDAIVEDSKRSL
ncbi:glycosyltransferase family 4 protein [bacterium]|nr:glycosyltransferase family 4 protein [bacterium]